MEIDSVISDVTLKEYSNYLWYPSIEAVALTFLDENIKICRNFNKRVDGADRNKIYDKKFLLKQIEIEGVIKGGLRI